MTREQFEKIMNENGYKIATFWQDADNGSIIANVYTNIFVYEVRIIEPRLMRTIQAMSTMTLHDRRDITDWFKEVDDMAQSCCNGGTECNGCMSCQEPKEVMKDTFGEPIYIGDEYYEIYDEIIAKDNLDRWAKEYLTNVDADMMDANCNGSIMGDAYMLDFKDNELFMGDEVYEFDDAYVYPDELFDWAYDYLKECEEEVE